MKKTNVVSCMTLAAMMAAGINSAVAQDKPTMGWSSWNTFALNISESVIKGQALAMKTSGLSKVGFNHINIDDGYFGGRDKETGELLIHPTRFPNGLLPVVKYIHNLGLKAGIYSDGGKNTCGNYHGGDKIAEGVGLYGYDQRDCDFFFKDMGFDFIKVDFCGGVSYHNSEGLDLDAETRYKEIAQAIKNTGRTDVRMNVCRWDYPGNWVQDVAASWRTTGDINASWGSVKDIIKQNLYLSAYCYGGHYNDMDMLEVGRNLTAVEDRTHFGMWCIMSSPLLIGCDMRNLNERTLALLKNEELIALNQDDLCIQAYVAQHTGDTYVLVKDIKQLYGNTRAVALYNPSDKAQGISINFNDIDLDGSVEVRDLLGKKDLGTMTDKLEATVPAHGAYFYTLTAEKRLERNLYEAETAYLGKYQEIFNNQWYKSAVYEENSLSSGGMYVGWLGSDPNNDIQWRHVYSDNGGEYTLEIKYISGDTRNIVVNVNGKDVKSLSCNSGGWSTLGTKTCNVTLEKGENVIRLYNRSASSWMPNIDCIKVKPVGASDRVTLGVASVNADASCGSDAYYTVGGVRTNNPVNGVFIHKGKKVKM